MIERKILINLISNSLFLKEIEDEWSVEYIESQAGRLISNWCWEYFKEYGKAPMQDIETIYLTKLKTGLSTDLADEIGNDILPGLSDEYELQNESNDHLLAVTRRFFIERQITIHTESLEFLLEKGKITEAKKLVEGFKLKEKVLTEGLDLSSKETLDKVEKAFDQTYQSVVTFPGALGEFWNDDLVRGGLISILAIEKRGKTFLLLEFMMRAYLQNKRVALFQAGDMSEDQQIIRIGIYLAQRSNKERYCGDRYIPVQDCIYNQKDTCTKRVRECSFGLFGDETTNRDEITREKLILAHENNDGYKPCYNCTEWAKNKWGTPFFKKIHIKEPLTGKQARARWNRFFVRAGESIKMSTHASQTLTVGIIERTLDKWEADEGFVPELILIDYGDIVLSESTSKDTRERENHKWMRFRALSQRPSQPLVIVPTQADAESYKLDTIGMSNFSEDKRKNAHVTASYALNQDKDGREKEIGIMRIGKIVVREGEIGGQVNVLQHLAIGRPFLGSYF